MKHTKAVPRGTLYRVSHETRLSETEQFIQKSRYPTS